MTLDFVDAHASLVYNISLWLHFAHYMIHRTMFNGLCLCMAGVYVTVLPVYRGVGLMSRPVYTVPAVCFQFKDGATASHN